MLLGDRRKRRRGHHRRRQDAGVEVSARRAHALYSDRTVVRQPGDDRGDEELAVNTMRRPPTIPQRRLPQTHRNAHACGDRRQRAGRAGARHRPVLRPRLQHRLADRVGDRAPEAPVAHHHRHARHADGDRADQEPARPPGADPSRGRHDAGAGRRSSANSRWSRSRGKGEKRVEALRLADAFRARVIDADDRELRLRDHRRERQDRAASSR